MRTNDDKLLAEAYDGMIKKNKEGSSLIDKELKKAAFSDQDQSNNVDQDGKDKTKKDPYTLKEAGQVFGGPNDGMVPSEGPQRSAEDYVDAIEASAKYLAGNLIRNGFFDANEDFMGKLAQVEILLSDLNEIAMENTREMG